MERHCTFGLSPAVLSTIITRQVDTLDATTMLFALMAQLLQSRTRLQKISFVSARRKRRFRQAEGGF